MPKSKVIGGKAYQSGTPEEVYQRTRPQGGIDGLVLGVQISIKCRPVRASIHVEVT